MISFLQSTAVVAIGQTPLVRTATALDAFVANFYNSSGATRSVSITTVNGGTFSFALFAGAAASVSLSREGNLTISADGAGVFGWLGKRSS